MAKSPTHFPTKEQVAAFIRESATPVGRREIARAFNVKGDDRTALRAMISELAEDGEVELGRKRKAAAPGTLPDVAVVEITRIDRDGELQARPVSGLKEIDEANLPKITVLTDRRSGPMAVGDRALARLERSGDASYRGRVIRRIGKAEPKMLGIFRATPEGGIVDPTNKKAKSDVAIRTADTGGAASGDLVEVELLPRARMGRPHGKIVQVFAGAADPRAFSRIAIHEHDIPDLFPDAVVDRAEKAKPVTLGKREDLRPIPLVTIDGIDARDFDDAVHAVPDEDAANPDGWKILVAIADVAHYVQPGDPLDREAFKRGNSVYFPDRVVPMLPEALSNGLCSLRPKEDRACLAVEMVIDKDGEKRRHRFTRGLMRSHARLTYRQVQEAIDGGSREGIPEGVLEPLYGAFNALRKARIKRGALEIDLPEKRVILNEAGDVVEIGVRDRLDAHMLIEEFMVLANVCAAETLEKRHQPCMYRVHDTPAPEKISALSEVLEGMEIPFAKGQVARAKQFNSVLAKAKGKPFERMVNELVLRSQAQAIYSPDNLGHFGLALQRYAHFTSPIRRYSDLLVHRALIRGLSFGAGGLLAEDDNQFPEWGEHISVTERRASAAERQTLDRYLARHLSDRIGTVLPGRINGVTRFGLFITLDETGADGLIPIRTLPQDYYDHDEIHHMLTGRSLGLVFRLGDRVEVRVREVEVASGAIALELVSGGEEGKAPSGARHGPIERRGRSGGPGKGGAGKFKPSRRKKPGTAKPRKKGKNR